MCQACPSCLSPFPDALLTVGRSPHGAPSVERPRDGKSEKHRDGEGIKRQRVDLKEDACNLDSLNCPCKIHRQVFG